nr:hypothetical protein [Tanacetum cinerariifolium]GFA12758.1 hypothetical protein [Tanacetum cinerariifolium]
MAQNIDFSGSDQMQTPQYPDVHPPSNEISDEAFHAKEDLMKSIQAFLEKFNCIPFEEKSQILLEAWFNFFEIKRAQPEDSNELFKKLLEDLKELAEYENSQSMDHPIFLNDNEDHYDKNEESFENPSNEIAASNSKEEKKEPPQDSDIHQQIEKCSMEVFEEQKQSMEDTMLELVKICQEKELLCIHDNVDDLIESVLNSKLLSINFQRLDNKEQEVKNVIEQPAERGNQSDEIIKSGAEELLPILSENEVTSEDKRECDFPVCENSPTCNDHSEIFSDSKDDDDISVYDDDFEDIEYVEASLSDPEIVNVEKENDVNQEEEKIDLEDISQIQDVDLQTRSDNTTHANESFLKYDSFCFEIEPDQERLINVVKSNVPDNSTSDPLLEEADLFLASDNSIPPGIENIANDSEGDIHFLEELLIDDSILSHESSESNFEDNPSVPRPPPEPPDVKTDVGEEIPFVMNDKDKFDEDYYFFMFDKVFSFLSAESEDTIFDPGISD